MLELRDVWRTYQVGESEVIALQGINLRVAAGEFLAVVGPSGSGKSTLLQIMGLLDRPTRGQVLLQGIDVSAESEASRAWLRLHRLGFVFQRFHLLRDLTAVENVVLPMEAAGVPLQQRYNRAAELLKSVGLGDRLTFRPAQLSGGQRQRVAIARALANGPSIILADEPTGELHSEDKARVLTLLHRCQAEGRTIIVVTHDPEVAAAAQRRLELRDGRAEVVVA